MERLAVLVAGSASARSTKCNGGLAWVLAFVLVSLLVATPAMADRGALSLDISLGAAALSLPAPYASSGGNILAADFEAMLGLRYAVTNELEFTLAGYFEPNVSYTHNNVTLTQVAYGSTTGNLTHSLSTYGIVAGIRYVRGAVWKLVVGLEGGWNHRTYSGIQFVFAGNQAALPGFPTDNIVLQPLLGVEWAFADHWSASLLPRFSFLIGPDSTVGASLMLGISYSWFL
jgi:hypothetical protein